MFRHVISTSPQSSLMSRSVHACSMLLVTVFLAGPVLATSSCPSSMVGDGSSDEPCQVANRTQLEAIADELALHYVLTIDIDLGVGGDWVPIGTEATPFTGHFDGASHTISNLLIPAFKLDGEIVTGIATTSDNQGLFGRSRNATIKNLNITGADVASSGQNIGILIGKSENTIVDNIDVEGLAWGHRAETYTGGASTPFSDRRARVGGLIGYAIGSTVTKVTVDADVYGDDFDESGELVADAIGGVIGEASGPSLSEVSFEGLVLGREWVGGLVGEAQDPEIEDSTISGQISGNEYVAGLIGGIKANTAFIRDVRVTDLALSTLDTDGKYVGGLVGYLQEENTATAFNMQIHDIKIDESVITSGAKEYVGGLIGYVHPTSDSDGALDISDIEINDLEINAASKYVGGVFGAVETVEIGDISDKTDIKIERILVRNLVLTNFGNEEYVGGIAGETRSRNKPITLRQLAVRNGVINAKGSEHVGGLVGRLRNNSLLDDRNVFVGTVDGGYRVGGLAGRLSSSSILNFGYVQAVVTGHTTGKEGEVGVITGYTSSNDQAVTEVYAVGTAKHATESSAEAPRIGVIGRVVSTGDVFEDIYYHIIDGTLPFIGQMPSGGAPGITNAVELTKAQMQGDQAPLNMTGVADPGRWNFETNWLANAGAYPIFRWEADVFAVEPDTVPGAPTGVMVVRGDTQATVSWSAPADDGGSVITGYTTTSDPGGQACTTTGATTCTVTGLTNGTAYTFTVVATNAVGESSASAASAAVVPAGAPSAPLAIEVEPRPGSLLVRWTTPLDNGGSPITHYVARANPGCEVSALPNEVPGETRYSCEIRGVSPGVSYTVFVAAFTEADQEAEAAAGAGEGAGNGTGVNQGGAATFSPLPVLPVPVNHPLFLLLLGLLALAVAGRYLRRGQARQAYIR